MFDKFTDRARKVMALAREEAKRFNHEYIGTEHILLGLVKEGSGVAANVLQNLDIDLKKIRMEVEKDSPGWSRPGFGRTIAFHSKGKESIRICYGRSKGLWGITT